MMNVLLVLQIMILVGLIASILLQHTSADGFTSMAGGSNLLSSRSSGNALTKVTFILIAAFMLNSLFMARMVSKNFDESGIEAKLSSISEKQQILNSDHNAGKANENKELSAPVIS